jgi:hypothetical protein
MYVVHRRPLYVRKTPEVMRPSPLICPLLAQQSGVLADFSPMSTGHGKDFHDSYLGGKRLCALVHETG